MMGNTYEVTLVISVAVDAAEEGVRVPPRDRDPLERGQHEGRLLPQFSDHVLKVGQNCVGNLAVTQPLHVPKS